MEPRYLGCYDMVMSSMDQQIARRRTFAIISHPDAGKTTLTEKFLLYGGALTAGAGAVKARGDRRSATSDWMELEQQRGISITSTVLQFPYRDHVVNLLDTPGHRDFSEDTYRVITAADGAVMVLDAAKGIEPQTLKLFEVCRARGLPLITFINKWDRPGREHLELMDEIEHVPPPTPRLDVHGAPRPLDAPFSGFVFKVQANMNPAHRDRLAFLRVCSGHFERGMVLTHGRTGKPFATKYAHQVFGQERI